jgi:hypothetical protein
MRMIKLLGFLMIFFTGVCFSILAQEEVTPESREKTSGIALTAGYGYEYAGLGVAAEWYVSAENPKFGLVLGVGYFPSMTIGTVATDPAVGIGAGARLAWGRNHRFIVDLQYGFAGEAARVSGGIRETADMYGITLGVGYQFLGRRGFVVHGGVGGTWIVGAQPWVTNLMGSLIPTLNIGIGYKYY